MRPARAASRRRRCAPALRGRVARALVAAALLLPLAGAATAGAEESLGYRWTLRGFGGRVAGLVMPNQGRGELRSRPANGGRITELEITSPAAGEGEFFLYGGETRPDGTTSRAWSSYRWRGRAKDEKKPVEEDGVVDVASGIHLIRQRHPDRPMSLRIWSDGKVYPVVVTKVRTESVSVPAGTFIADHYRIRGVRGPGERTWKGGLDIWLAKDEAATPVRIQVERGFANVRLELLPGGVAEPGHAHGREAGLQAATRGAGADGFAVQGPVISGPPGLTSGSGKVRSSYTTRAMPSRTSSST